MLAHYPRRQQLSNLQQQYHDLPSPSSLYNFPTTTPLTATCHNLSPDTSLPASTAHNYSQRPSDSYMPASPSYNPPPHYPQAAQSLSVSEGTQSSYYSSVREATGCPSGQWLSLANTSRLTPQSRQQQLKAQGRQSPHKRNSSGSSNNSLGPASPYTPTATFPRIVDSDVHSHPSPGYDGFESPQSALATYQKSLPKATISDSFAAPTFTDYNSSVGDAEPNIAFQMAMRQALMAQHESDMGNGSSPTPRGSYRGEYDDGFKGPSDMRNNMPKLDRTMSDIYQDELYNPNIMSQAPASRPHAPITQKNLFSPHKDVFSERLQAANSARSASPVTSVSRELSPFRQGSEWANEGFSQTSSPGARLGSAARIREQQKAEADAVIAFAQRQPSVNRIAESRTISPKEALLDYKETVDEVEIPLFPQEITTARSVCQNDQFPAMKSKIQNSISSTVNDGTVHKNFDPSRPTKRASSNYSVTPTTRHSKSSFSNGSGTPVNGIQIPQQYPFISQSMRQNSSIRGSSEQVPEFHATLTSMESTKSETGSGSSQEQGESTPEIKRPASTQADSGTYTCTYHGCTLRFETPSKLQRHKREAHRQSTERSGSQSTVPGSVVSNSGMSVSNRNSQAGPHKCERINPSTGKPCNSIFSRPYDLTRHEDTIHNARKQKVRCQLCTEEKTFSRNDALTRHMRVVHPEVEFPGKSRRKGGS